GAGPAASVERFTRAPKSHEKTRGLYHASRAAATGGGADELRIASSFGRPSAFGGRPSAFGGRPSAFGGLADPTTRDGRPQGPRPAASRPDGQLRHTPPVGDSLRRSDGLRPFARRSLLGPALRKPGAPSAARSGRGPSPGRGVAGRRPRPPRCGPSAPRPR